MIREFLNLKGVGAPEVLNISLDRCEEMQTAWEEMIIEVANEKNKYSYSKHDDHIGLSVGGCLAKMLESATCEKEEIYCIMNIDIFMDKVVELIYITKPLIN